jgi:hypothetical protein
MEKVKINWEKIKYFSFITSTKKHKRRRVVPINKLKKCIEQDGRKL